MDISAMSKKKRRPILDYLVYLAVRTIVCIVQALSVEMAYALARGIAWILHRVDARHRKIALENLQAAYGDALSEAERQRIVRGVYLHFCMMLMEMILSPRRFWLNTWRGYVRVTNQAPLISKMLSGGPSIVLSGHFGNWEMAGYLFGVFGFDSFAVARKLDNEYLDNYLQRFRQRTGQTIIPKKGGFDQMVEVLRHGRTLVILGDQDAGPNGLFVDFFGRPASTHKAIALLAIENQAPIFVVYARRLGDRFAYEIGIEDVIDPAEFAGSSSDVRDITQRFTSALERVVRRDPEQYLWLHRRWKHQPKPRGRKARAAAAAVEAEAAATGATAISVSATNPEA